jgi:hypothetical protein
MEMEPRLLNILMVLTERASRIFIWGFRMLNELVERHPWSFVGKAAVADELLHFGHKATDRIGVELTFGVNSYRYMVVAAPRDTPIFEDEIGLFVWRISTSRTLRASKAGTKRVG